MAEKTLGILGGIGPLATVYFMDLIVKMTDAVKDQDHISMIVLNHAAIPDRTEFILDNSKPNPLPVMIDDAKKLQAAGADYVVMPCNTAHYFYEQIQASILRKVPEAYFEGDNVCLTIFPTIDKVQTIIRNTRESMFQGLGID